MQTPPRITFRHMTNSPALEARVLEHVDHLQRVQEHITGCEVVITAPSGHHQNGAPFEVRITVTVPDGMLHAGNPGMADVEHADAYVAVRDAFGALERMIRKQADQRHRGRDHESIRRLPATAAESDPNFVT